MHASRGGVKISHLFFTDDILLFTEAGEDQIDCIKDGLRRFCSATGQKINYNKSPMLISPNISDQVALRLSTSIGIPRPSELGRYLGDHILHHGNNGDALNQLVQRVRAHLDGWTSKCWSRARQIALAQSVLNNIAIFQMQFQKLPSRNHKGLDRNIRRYVWGTS